MSLYHGYARDFGKDAPYIPLTKWSMNSYLTLKDAIKGAMKDNSIYSSTFYVMTPAFEKYFNQDLLIYVIDHNNEKIQVNINPIEIDQKFDVYIDTLYPVNMDHLSGSEIEYVILDKARKNCHGYVDYDENIECLIYRCVFSLDNNNPEKEFDINFLLNETSVAIDNALDYFDKIREQYNLYV